MDKIEVIYDTNIVATIVEFIDKKRNSDDLKIEFPNALLRGDVLALLDKFCTVIYYPLDDEGNNGFHVNIPMEDGGTCHFVFINTDQAVVKQVFTAAHELGHIWKVDDYVANKCCLDLSNEQREQIINRFAAELLIPKDQFSMFLSSALPDLDIEEGRITINNMIKLIAKMMNFFFVPMKSIVMRFAELGAIDEKSAELLLGQQYIPKEKLKDDLESTIIDLGYTRLLERSRRKWIEGLADMVDVVENKNIFPQSKISNIRKAFDLEKKNATSIDETVKLDAAGIDATKSTVSKEDGIYDRDK